ncbi:MAG: glycerol-3-phosphate dehydrogenase/oxidase [Thermoplasmata archaeon]
MINITDERNKIVNSMTAGVDVLIVGGGITGAGVLNLLSSIGISCALIESEDFARGTSSRSSKLIHGGLRYLAHGNISIVRQSVKERDFLLKNSDAVKKIGFMIPIDQYSWSKSSLGFGLRIYSLFSKNIKAKWMSKDEIIKEEPVFENIDFRGAYVYAEGIANDARLVINTILSAEKNGAIILNYAELKSIVFDDVAKEAVVIDKIGNREFRVPFKFMVNATGPWIANLFEQFKSKYAYSKKLKEHLKLSKGAHIMISKELFPINNGIAVRSPIDKRQIFIIPRGEVLLIGTTETYFNGNLRDPEVDENDVKYLIDSVKTYIPTLSEKDVISVFAGVRPLFGKNQDLGNISREYKVFRTGNIINIMGGKLTTFRTVSMKVSKILEREMNLKKEPFMQFSYKREIDFRKEELSKLLADNKLPVSEDSITFAYDIIYEHAYHIEDILWRREGVAIFSADEGRSKLNICSDVLKNMLGYDDAAIKKEESNYAKSLSVRQKFM